MDNLRQLPLFESENLETGTQLDASLWQGSFNGRESTLQQISPYIGKMKSGMARVLVNLYSRPGQIVLDPFSGSGVVPLEAALGNRVAWANDLSPYAYTLTRGKLEAPRNISEALERTRSLIEVVERKANSVDLGNVPEWVRDFFNPQTLQEILVAVDELKIREDNFLMSCLLGILHHVRPGFLSYPASHLVPYLRKSKYPREDFPEMYTYRDLASRLVAKVRRAYRRSMLSESWDKRDYMVWQTNAMSLPIPDESVDSVISSPPYFGALDYARDNRLRLWFLGCSDWKELDRTLTASTKVYIPQMSLCFEELNRVLKLGSYCVLVLGDVEREGETKHTAEILASLATRVTNKSLRLETIYDDYIPDIRRSRRKTRTTKFERILVMRKS
jgi:RMKL-like, methyltransferase domain